MLKINKCVEIWAVKIIHAYINAFWIFQKSVSLNIKNLLGNHCHYNGHNTLKIKCIQLLSIIKLKKIYYFKLV